MARISNRSRNAGFWASSQVLNTCLDWPSRMSSSLSGPAPSQTGLRSMMTVTNSSPRRVWHLACSSTPRTWIPSKRVGSAISNWRAVARRASLTVARKPEPVGDPGDRHQVDDDNFRRPHHGLRRQFRPRRGGQRRVLISDLPAARSPQPAARSPVAVAADADMQNRCPPAERTSASGRSTLSLATLRQAWHQSSGSTTRQSNTSSSGCSCWPTASKPSHPAGRTSPGQRGRTWRHAGAPGATAIFGDR
jgi:hypothetical protein